MIKNLFLKLTKKSSNLVKIGEKDQYNIELIENSPVFLVKNYKENLKYILIKIFLI